MGFNKEFKPAFEAFLPAAIPVFVETSIMPDRHMYVGHAELKVTNYTGYMGKYLFTRNKKAFAYTIQPLSGISLYEFLGSRIDMPPFVCAHLFFSLIEFLRCAHANNVVHRDLNFGNILLELAEEGYQMKIVDWATWLKIKGKHEDYDGST